jgi:Domain of unknown function (DUF4919)
VPTYDIARFLFDYVSRPSDVGFRQLRERYLDSGIASFYDEIFLELQDAVERRQLNDALLSLYVHMPRILLTPRAHWWAATLENELNGTDVAQLEQDIGDRLLEGIMGTGAGSRAKPFQVLRVDDEYDVLSALGKTFASQALFADPRCDVITCSDASELWFDVSEPYLRSMMDR